MVALSDEGTTLRSLKSLLLLTLTAFVPAQSSTPQLEQQPDQSFTLQTGAQLVVVDIVVTDKSGNPVHNLTQSDFTLLENGAPQRIGSFDEHTATSAVTLPPMPTLSPGSFTNYSPAPATPSLNVLLLDTLNTPLNDQVVVRDQLIKFVKTAKPGARIAIFGLTSRLLLLQSFTSDPAILRAAVEQNNLQNSALLANPVTGGNTENLADHVGLMARASSSQEAAAMAGMVAALKQFQAQTDSFQLQLRAKYTLDAMDQIARYLANFPGRKNLIWFSGSFPLDILPDGDVQDPFASVNNSRDEFQATTNLLSHAQVAVYPVDARGLFPSPNTDVTQSGDKYGNQTHLRPQDTHGLDQDAFSKDENSFNQRTATENTTMNEMARQTGGRAFINNNDLADAVAQAIDSGSNFYTLTYAPTDTRFDGRYRKIQVNLQQHGYTLAYRRGYFSEDSTHPNKLYEAAAAPTPRTDTMRIAMLRGAPDPSQIIFKASILPASATAEDKVTDGNMVNPDLKLSHGPYRRYQIAIAADPHPITFTPTPDHLYHADLQLRTYVYEVDGILINEAVTNTVMNLTPQVLNRLLNSGLALHQQISVPVKGDYYLRIGIHDLTNDRVGAIELPVATVKNLVPLSASATPIAAPAVAPK